MDQISVTSTLERIQELIDKNSGDTGRLNHIIDFINNEKPLYKTDRIYLENKLNHQVIITPKKIIPEEDSSSKKIKKLLKMGKGDPGRLEHILIMLEKDKKLYNSDKQYLVNNFGISIIESQKIENNVKIEKNNELKEKIKVVMPKNWKAEKRNQNYKKYLKK